MNDPETSLAESQQEVSFGTHSRNITVLHGVGNRQHSREHLKGNGQQTPTKEGQIEATIDTVIDDVKGPVKQINAIKNTSVTMQLKKDKFPQANQTSATSSGCFVVTNNC